MVSAIDATKPEDGELPVKADFRANFLAAKNEIVALQAEIVALLTALGISTGEEDFPVLNGGNAPQTRQILTAILIDLYAKVDAAANSGGSVGPITLANITDLLTPSDAQRAAFQRPIDGGSIDTDFLFNTGAHAGRWLALNTTNNTVTMSLPAAASVDRPDGWLCRVTATSGSNFGAVTGPDDALRFQSDRIGATVTQTTVFLGRSRSAGLRSLVDIYKDGSIYQVVGAGRVTETDDLRTGAPQTIPGTALVNGSLQAAAFPDVFDLGGTKRTGGSRIIEREVAGNTVLAQSDAGNSVVHTGGGDATWEVPDLLDGTGIDLENDGGAITLNPTGEKNVKGGLILPADRSGAVRFRNGRIKFIGTS